MNTNLYINYTLIKQILKISYIKLSVTIYFYCMFSCYNVETVAPIVSRLDVFKFPISFYYCKWNLL